MPLRRLITLLHPIRKSDGLEDGLLLHASTGELRAPADVRAVAPAPRFLDSQEEIGWKAQQQSSRL
jgi:hypothetical protein